MENNETNVPRIIAMANMKGGVGKTTSTICTAIALNKLGRKVEVRDIDPQGSATLWAAKARAESAAATISRLNPIAPEASRRNRLAGGVARALASGTSEKAAAESRPKAAARNSGPG